MEEPFLAKRFKMSIKYKVYILVNSCLYLIVLGITFNGEYVVVQLAEPPEGLAGKHWYWDNLGPSMRGHVLSQYWFSIDNLQRKLKQVNYWTSDGQQNF